jgi:hypothetical protein
MAIAKVGGVGAEDALEKLDFILCGLGVVLG